MQTKRWIRLGVGAASVIGAVGARGADGVVSADDLAKHPEKYHRRQVIVRAKVDRLYNGRYFTLDENAAAAGPDVLVLVPEGGRAVTEDDEVTVSGTVREFVQAEIEHEYPWFRPDEEVTLTFRSRPVIVATSVRTRGGVELVEQPSPPPVAPLQAVPVPGKVAPDPARSGSEENR